MKIYKLLRDLYFLSKHFTQSEGDLKMVTFVPLLAVLQWDFTYNPAVLQKLKSLHILFGL